jgi:hypothetical protein
MNILKNDEVQLVSGGRYEKGAGYVGAAGKICIYRPKASRTKTKVICGPDLTGGASKSGRGIR